MLVGCASKVWIALALLAHKQQLNIGVQCWLFTFYWQNSHEVTMQIHSRLDWPQLWIVLCMHEDQLWLHSLQLPSLHIVLGMPTHLSITTVFTTINSTNSSHRSFQWWERLAWYSSAVKENAGWRLLGTSDTWHMCIMLLTIHRKL